MELDCSLGLDVRNRISSHDRYGSRTKIAEPRESIADMNGISSVSLDNKACGD